MVYTLPLAVKAPANPIVGYCSDMHLKNLNVSKCIGCLEKAESGFSDAISSGSCDCLGQYASGWRLVDVFLSVIDLSHFL